MGKLNEILNILVDETSPLIFSDGKRYVEEVNTEIDKAKQAIIKWALEDIVGEDENRHDAQDRVAFGIDIEEERMKVHRNRLRAEIRAKIRGKQ